MVGLWSPDPPPEPENLEENNAGYLIVVSASDEEPEDEGFEGYEPLSDADADADDDVDDDGAEDDNDDVDDLDPQFTNASASDCDAQERITADLPRSTVNSHEFCKTYLPATEENGEAGPSAECNSQESSEGVEAGPSTSRLEMGEQQVADVMAAMANVTLPASAVPQWATVVPEDQWIQHILARVKLLQDKRMNDK